MLVNVHELLLEISTGKNVASTTGLLLFGILDFGEKISCELQTLLAQNITDPDVTFNDLVTAATSQAFILDHTTHRDKRKPETKAKEQTRRLAPGAPRLHLQQSLRLPHPRHSLPGPGSPT